MPYAKQAFDPDALEHAKAIVLTPDPKHPNKFEEETDFLMNFLKEHRLIRPTDVVFDFGCGMGRLSKAIIETFGTKVIGQDISERMLMIAEQYVQNPAKFRITTDYTIPESIDVIISSFVLQHSEDPAKEIKRFNAVLKPGGRIVLLDGDRLVPMGIDADRYVIWRNDDISVIGLMGQYFKNIGYYAYCYRENDNNLSVWQKE